VRATLQFWKFARFDPAQPPLTAEEYRKRLKRLFRIPAWRHAQVDRVIFPGYACLWDFSKAQQRLVQEEIGAWLPTYFRPGNWRMACPIIRFLQKWTAAEVAADIESQGPQALYLAKFPSMNHAVIAYAYRREADGHIAFQLYDPNYPGESARLRYDPAENLFDFEKRFYWPGGLLRAIRIYRSPFR
jgi:hypothetical protein